MRTLALLAAVPLFAADWPEWRGAGRRGEWKESGILERFPESGLKIRWRTPIKPGFTGPSVADGRVFVMDADKSAVNRATERALALDPKIQMIAPWRMKSKCSARPNSILQRRSAGCASSGASNGCSVKAVAN